MQQISMRHDQLDQIESDARGPRHRVDMGAPNPIHPGVIQRGRAGPAFRTGLSGSSNGIPALGVQRCRTAFPGQPGRPFAACMGELNAKLGGSVCVAEIDYTAQRFFVRVRI